ncbi:MAG: hypothetical protein E6I65_07905 [Chloroflexi bacterium]|nr:MAG: hypothetical protein E6I65_07905 [Chloroflexota bacterium]
MTAVGEAAPIPSDLLLTEPRSPRRWIVLLAATAWLAVVLMGLATAWASFGTDFFRVAAAASGASPSPDQVLIINAAIGAFLVITIGYATVGALLAGRVGAGRIAATLLLGALLFALVPFGYIFGGILLVREPDSPLLVAIQLLGPVAIGPGFVSILPGLAIVFPDGRLPSPRWRWPVALGVASVGFGTFLQLIRPDALVGVVAGAYANPFAVDGLPPWLGSLAYPTVSIGILVMTLLGILAVVVRYRRGDVVDRQQLRWFLAAVSLAALPLAMTVVPSIGGPGTGLLAAVGLVLVPISVGIAVTRYRLYQIDHLISRTLVYVPLTALLAGLYAAVVTLLQRVFQTVTGDRSDAAIIISTLILASVFTPIRKWLEGIVERRYKPTASAEHADPALGSDIGGPEWEARVAAVALRVVRSERELHPAVEPPA